MSSTHAADHRLSIVDDDPLRARREARELLADLAATDPCVALHVPGSGADPASGTDKGGSVSDMIGLVFGGGSLAASVIQIWLARVPQRTIVVTRPDGMTIRISGKEARADDAYIERFLAAGPSHGTRPDPARGE